MATSKEFKNFVLEQLSLLDEINSRPMMGGYLFYYRGVLFGGLYGDRFLVKKVEETLKYQLQEEIPYSGAKPMYLVDELDHKELIKQIVLDTYEGLIKTLK